MVPSPQRHSATALMGREGLLALEALGPEFGNFYAPLPRTVSICEVTQNDALSLYQSVPVNRNGSSSLGFELSGESRSFYSTQSVCNLWDMRRLETLRLALKDQKKHRGPGVIFRGLGQYSSRRTHALSS